MRPSVSTLLLLATLALPSCAVKHEDFRKCKDSAFCRRGRALAQRAKDAAPGSWKSPYTVIDEAVRVLPNSSGITAVLQNELYPEIKFRIEVRVHEDGVVRVRADEVKGLKKRYDEAASWALIAEPKLAPQYEVTWAVGAWDTTGYYKGREIRVYYKPFRIVLFQDGREDIVLNQEGLFHMEHFRLKAPAADKTEEEAPKPEEAADQKVIEETKKPAKASAWFEGEEEDGYWEETFKSWTDSKPKGPESISMDVSFPGHQHVYGIPQHAAPLSLPTTTGPDSFFDDPYRLWNLDVFEHEASSTMSLYGSIPLMHAHSAKSTPSVFNGPEITMQKDNIHYGGWEHRDVHNINGMLYANQTARAMVAREDVPKRPFVLSRSFFAGSQRHGAIWTGDNMGTWEHMKVGLQMALADGIAGMTFSGADVGGFFGNPGPEMLTRWYQLGVFFPFFRAHAHIDTKRREPYLLDEPYKSIIRDLLHLRYSLLPVWYTAFRETSVTGMPLLRPQYVMFPKDFKGFGIDDQFYVGSTGLLVKPITQEGVTETSVWLAENEAYYDYFTYKSYQGSKGGKLVTISTPLEKFPVLIRGGSILATRERPRRSSALMKHDPFTLTIALDSSGGASGQLYLDDGESYSHQKGELIWREFQAAVLGKKAKKGSLQIMSIDLATAKPDEAVDGAPLSSTYLPTNTFAQSIKDVKVERIKVVGLLKQPKEVLLHNETPEPTPLAWEWDSDSKVLTVKNPSTKIVEDWTITVKWV
ncbi:hypothetical protein FRB90_008878 [Tulasnella sp. 427]|nr:hypothetical protein FRB90_008878 [Tulasnella sp. 427]